MRERLYGKKGSIYVLALICSVFWGFSFLAITTALEKLETIPLLTLRWTVSALLFIILRLFHVIKVNYRSKKTGRLLALSLFQPCLYSIFETLGVNRTTVSEASIIVATIPLMVIITGALFLREKCSPRTILGVLAALTGAVVCVCFSPAFSVGGKWAGYVYLLIAVIVASFYVHLSNRSSQDFNPVEVTMMMSLAGAVFFNILNFTWGNGIRAYAVWFSGGKIFLDVMFLGVCCSCICYLLFNHILGKLPTAAGSNLITNLTTVVGVLSGVCISGDPFGWYTAAGVALMVTGICITSGNGKA